MSLALKRILWSSFLDQNLAEFNTCIFRGKNVKRYCEFPSPLSEERGLILGANLLKNQPGKPKGERRENKKNLRCRGKHFPKFSLLAIIVTDTVFVVFFLNLDFHICAYRKYYDNLTNGYFSYINYFA